MELDKSPDQDALEYLNVVGVLPQGVSLPVDGQRVGGDGYTWWRLTIRDGAWIREDTTEEIGDCSAVPGV